MFTDEFLTSIPYKTQFYSENESTIKRIKEAISKLPEAKRIELESKLEKMDEELDDIDKGLKELEEEQKFSLYRKSENLEPGLSLGCENGSCWSCTQQCDRGMRDILSSFNYDEDEALDNFIGIDFWENEDVEEIEDVQ